MYVTVTVLVLDLDSVTVNAASFVPVLPSTRLVSVIETLGTAVGGRSRDSISRRIRASMPVSSCTGDGGRPLIPNSDRKPETISAGLSAAAAVWRAGATSAFGTFGADTAAGSDVVAETCSAAAGSAVVLVALELAALLESVSGADVASSVAGTCAWERVAEAGRDADGVRVDFLGASTLPPDGSCAVRREVPVDDFDGFDGCDAEPPSGVSATATPGLAATARPRLIANAAEPTRNPNAVELMAPPYLDDLSATLSINP